MADSCAVTSRSLAGLATSCRCRPSSCPSSWSTLPRQPLGASSRPRSPGRGSTLSIRRFGSGAPTGGDDGPKPPDNASPRQASVARAPPAPSSASATPATPSPEAGGAPAPPVEAVSRMASAGSAHGNGDNRDGMLAKAAAFAEAPTAPRPPGRARRPSARPASLSLARVRSSSCQKSSCNAAPRFLSSSRNWPSGSRGGITSWRPPSSTSRRTPPLSPSPKPACAPRPLRAPGPFSATSPREAPSPPTLTVPASVAAGGAGAWAWRHPVSGGRRSGGRHRARPSAKEVRKRETSAPSKRSSLEQSSCVSRGKGATGGARTADTPDVSMPAISAICKSISCHVKRSAPCQWKMPRKESPSPMRWR
mmetsp:Transcript_108724/g.313266  ORF Transcript_108724/g.313266 Transcript_108724/m.313266 type:complete len:365 (-) Transcript_108724:1648-2742(-)